MPIKVTPRDPPESDAEVEPVAECPSCALWMYPVVWIDSVEEDDEGNLLVEKVAAFKCGFCRLYWEPAGE